MQQLQTAPPALPGPEDALPAKLVKSRMLSVQEALRGIPRSLGNTIGCDAGLSNGVGTTRRFAQSSHELVILPLLHFFPDDVQLPFR